MSLVITNWIISIVGIVIIGLLVDLILPDGQMQKYIKSIFSIIVVLVMISPVLNIDIKNIDFDKFIYNENTVELNENYLKNFNEEYIDSLETLLEENLKNNGYSGVIAEIFYNLSNNNIKIEKIEINIKNLVINTNQVHIDKYKEIRALTCKMLNIKEDLVVIYG